MKTIGHDRHHEGSAPLDGLHFPGRPQKEELKMSEQTPEQEWQWAGATGLLERARLRKRRSEMRLPDGVSEASETIGLALSGGGIRSATVSLGALQSLARLRLLESVDYLSTVSGGGYIGAFFGSLFAREPRATQPKADPYGILAGSYSKPHGDGDKSQHGRHQGSELWWLRSSGRYLAPTGAGDFIYALAMQLRNWLAVHLVLGMAILVLTGPIIAADAALQAAMRHVISTGQTPLATGMGLAALSLVALLLWTVPAGFAFFACEMPKATAKSARPWWLRGTIIEFLVVVIAFAVLAFTLSEANAGRIVRWLVAIGFDGLQDYRGSNFFAMLFAGLSVVLLIAVFLLVAAGTAVDAGRYVPGAQPRDEMSPQGLMQTTRVVLTKWLATSLKAVLVLAGAGVTVALSRLLIADWGQMKSEFILSAGGAAGVALLVIRQMAGFIEKLSKMSFLRFVPVNAIVLAIGLLLIASVIVGWFCLAWVFVESISGRPLQDLASTTDCIAPVATLSFVMLAIGFVVGTSFQFLNMSTLQSLYASRLTRAYLGASNPHRTIDPDPRWTRISDMHPADDLPLERYFHEENAAPIHLINVTLNETVSPTDPLVQRDRHGRPMTVTPDHYCIDGHFMARDPSKLGATSDSRRATEELSLGQWISISGAAFSTGVGRQTSLGKSLTFGLANVRLGHWWGAGALAKTDKPGLDSVLRGISRTFETQAYLCAELFARFRGRYSHYWYLSDGGHFENTGLYELLRRKVGLVIALDNGADPTYASDDVANAMRLARIDFGCEQFEFAPDMLRSSSLLAPLVDRLVTSDTPGRGQYGDNACMRLLWAYRQDAVGAQPEAFIAGGTAILVLKPRLVKTLSLDVREYATTHAAFPQETTADQFFTEEQWESYRKMGQTLVDALRSLPGLPAATPLDAQALLLRVRHEMGQVVATLMRDPNADLRVTRELQSAVIAET
jgi:hypothetical protein